MWFHYEACENVLYYNLQLEIVTARANLRTDSLMLLLQQHVTLVVFTQEVFITELFISHYLV